MKYLFGITFLLCFACGNKENILLPKANQTIVKEVADLSPIYIFFRMDKKDTLVDVNRNNSIGTTNWVINVDKRLPLRLVIPEIIKLQKKKRGDSSDKIVTAQNYYSYADSIGQNLAFLPFTKVHYKMEKPKSGIEVYFDKSNKIFVDNKEVAKNNLEKYMKQNGLDSNVFYCFDKNMSFNTYIKLKIFLRNIEWKYISNQEFVF